MTPKPAYWWFRLRSSWRWYRDAVTRYDVHSPLLADFIQWVITDKRPFHVFDLVKQLRSYWAKHPGVVKVLTHGAASKVSDKEKRSVAELVKNSAIGPREGAQLFRLALWMEAQNIVELGTNAGISTLYLHFANRRAIMHTIEANPVVAGMARKTFEIARCGIGLHQHLGTFVEVLPRLLPTLTEIDLLFIDGDHRYQATLDYFRQCAPKLHAKSVVVVADIHWSQGMERAWSELLQQPGVTASLDTYHFGILFFKPGMTPHQHLKLVDTIWKPWRMGFFS